jgi:transposase
MGKGATTRRYTEEFKRDAVALLRSSGRPIAEVAKQLGVTDTSLGSWAREQAKAVGESDAEAAKEAAELRKRIRELEQEIDILKRFTAYWVKDSGR